MSSPDINNLETQSEYSEYGGGDYEGFYKPSLPDDGPHLAIVSLGTRGVMEKETKTGPNKGRKYIDAQLTLKLQDSGLVVFYNPTNIPMKSKNNMSELEAFMGVIGSPLRGRMGKDEVKAAVEAACASTPMVTAFTQWKADVKDASGEWKHLKIGQKNFPPVIDPETGQQMIDENGRPKYNPEVEDPKTREIVTAQVNVLRVAKA